MADADRGDLVLGLEGDDAVALEIGQRMEQRRRRRDRIGTSTIP